MDGISYKIECRKEFSKVKFIFSKKATKIDEIFIVDLTLTTSGAPWWGKTGITAVLP